MKCCEHCFVHAQLQEIIRNEGQAGGTCDYCGTVGVTVIEARHLYPPFENLMTLYVPLGEANRLDGLSPDGESLIQMIQDDYDVFSDELFSSGRAEQLLDDILQSGWDDDSGDAFPSATELYVRSSDEWGHEPLAQAWQDYCTKVKENPEKGPDFPPWFEEELERLVAKLSVGNEFYRARLGYEVVNGAYQSYRGSAIGAPPKDATKPGRANRQYEVMLYVADDECTAVAEVRPARGNLVSVAKMAAVRECRLVDLTKVRHLANPFTDELPQFQQELEDLLDAFAEELGRPLRRSDDYQEYLPSQMLVHRIRAAGYDGIRYPSAMDRDGTNVVLFDPTAMEVKLSWLVEVTDIGLAFQRYDAE